VTTERVRVTGKIPPITLPEAAKRAKPEPVSRRRVYHEGAYHDAPVYLRGGLGEGAAIVGPAIIEQDDSTTWILPGWSASVDRIGNMRLASPGKKRAG